MSKISLKKLDDSLEGKDYILILGIGFDPRCLEAVKSISVEKLSRVLGVCTPTWGSLSDQNIKSFKELLGQKAELVGNPSDNIIKVTDRLAKHLEALTNEDAKIIIDVTAFSHELLSILLGIMNSYKILDSATFLYVGASEYSFNTGKEHAAIWLSRGVDRIRSVLGFPGLMLPSKKLHLILLAGFETERASIVIDAYEPAYLSIGTGRKNQSVKVEHYDTNQYFVDSLTNFVKNQELYNENVHHFEFSCVDPCQTKQDLIDHIESFADKDDRNFVVCPLNTKLSTVGVTLAALERPNIQICYAEPLEYNTEGYAKPGDEVTIISLNACIPNVTT
jgi:hypothetical protein